MLKLERVRDELERRNKSATVQRREPGIYIYSTGKSTRNNKEILLWVPPALLCESEYGTRTEREEMRRETVSVRAVGHYLVHSTLQCRCQKGTEDETMRIPYKMIQTFSNGGEVPRLKNVL
jgi:hypothetical protein